MSQEPTEPTGQEPTPQEPPSGQQPGQEPEPQTFDREYVQQLRAEAARHRTEAQEAKSRVEEFERANQTDLERVSGERDTLKSELEPTKQENLRLRVALDKKLPPELVDRLKGGTKEEMEADADSLLELVGQQQPPPNFGGGPRRPADSTVDMDTLIRQRAGHA